MRSAERGSIFAGVQPQFPWEKPVVVTLSHCDHRIPRDLYEQVMPQMDEEAARKTDEYFRRAFGG